MKYTTNIVITAVAWLLLCVTVSIQADEMARLKAWQQDIDVYAQQLQRHHIDLFHSTSKKAFDNQVQTLKHQLPNLSDNQVMVRLMRITKSIGDGHTSFPLWGVKAHKFPIRLRAINNKLYVEETTSKFKQLLGHELVGINGVSVKNVVDALSNRVPFSENPFSTMVRVSHYITLAEVLNGTGFIGDDYRAQFTFKRGEHVSSETLDAVQEQDFQHHLSLAHPVTKNRVKEVSQWLGFSASPDKKTVYVKFERYADLNAMKDFAESLLDFINQHQSENLVIDLRNNYGGDFFAGLTLAQYLVRADSLNWRSGIYTLINNDTFSAAMSNAAQFSQILNATLVGQPTGAKPAGYQDMGQFTLPNSKRVVTYSKRYYDFLGIADDAIYPDQHIGLTIEDYKTNSDRQLNWVVEQVGWH